MSEYEGAIHAALATLYQEVIELGANRNKLIARLQVDQERLVETGSRNGAAAIGLLIRSIEDN